MTLPIQPIILAGGTGSRLWPLSRELYPKQLLRLTNHLSLLQNTLMRVGGVMPAPLIVVGEEHRFITKSQVEELGFAEFTILLEPLGRNTAPAIAGAVEYLSSMGAGAEQIVMVLPADHLITDTESFIGAAAKAAVLAGEGSIVTFGIPPAWAETGYGYIERGEGDQVASFTEKPSPARAEQYLRAGNYFWNSGMFTFSLATMQDQCKQHAPDILAAMADAVRDGSRDGCFYRFDGEAMRRCPAESIDYAVMEKTSHAAVVSADLGWSDIGSWQALYQVLDKDDRDNVNVGDVVSEDVSRCLLRAEDRLVAAVGLEDTLVVETADAVLVAPLDRAQDVKQLVTTLKKGNRDAYRHHRTQYRPWGSYTVLEKEDRYQIKRISVAPGKKLSLQMHHHRNEHWVVVSGTARIVKGEKEIILHENESVYVAAGTTHRLENPGVIHLELIEVQIGSYLGEDDIVRFEDDYGREKNG
jgi:mannose-1-phosphate guanylyltransferase/mannose-6-phosphate isomerase